MVDDEPGVLRLVAAILGQMGLQNVQTAKDIQSATDAWSNGNGQFDLLVCDYSLPEGPALPLIHHAALQNASLKIIMMSGYSRREIEAMGGTWNDRISLLEKPFTPAELTELVRAQLTEITA